VGARVPAGKCHRRGAGGDDQRVVSDRAGVGVQRAGFEGGGPAAQAQVDPGEVDVEGGVVGLPEEDGLGQRRSVVRRMRLGADQRHRAGPPVRPQRGHGLRPGEPGTDDHDPLHRTATSRMLAAVLTPSPTGVPSPTRLDHYLVLISVGPREDVAGRARPS
jgi:hypothetical protein